MKIQKFVLLVTFAAWLPVAFAANAWMQEARRTPEWFSKGVMYQIQVRAFTEEGTLKAAERKLPYLKDLGVTIAYLVPVMKMDASADKTYWSPRQVKCGSAKNQYRIADYFHVDEEFGTDQDLKDFCAAAHRLGMKVLFDLVYLHCGPTAPFLKEHPDFTWWNEDGTVKKGPYRFPKLNFANPGLRKYFDGNVRYLLTEYGADGFRCDVGDGIPLDFWCDLHDTMDAVTAGHAVLLCEGYTVCNQYKGFDADYGWFPGLDAKAVRREWVARERECPRGAKFVNHYENHDIGAFERPRRESAWGHAQVDQVLVWMFTADGVPMLFTGNELADADERQSMFRGAPMDWSQLEREPGKSRHAFVKRLAELRRTHPALTAVNGEGGLTWLDTTNPEKVTAFVRRGGGETLLVVQNWSKEDVSCNVSFAVRKGSRPSYLAADEGDQDIRGRIGDACILSRQAEKTGERSFRLGPWGFIVAPMAVAMDADAVLRLGRTNEVPRVIFDTDMVEDYDDVGALAALHALADEDRCEILATVSCTRGNQSVATVEVINAYYGRKDIPVGCAKGIGVEGTTKGRADMSPHQKYVRIAKDFSRHVRHASSDDAPDANVIYRKVLSAAPDKGVTVCSVGFLTNLRRLLETKPDSISSLSGVELVTKKVKALYAMAGKYPQGREYNVEWDIPSARVVFDRWPTPIFISDFNLGRSIYSGRKVSETEYGHPNPVKDIYARSLPSRAATHESRCWDREEGGHSSWDPVTVLASVLDSTPYFTVRHGYFTIDESGVNTWHDDPAKAGGVLECATSCGHSRQSIGALLDNLIARRPKSVWGM